MYVICNFFLVAFHSLFVFNFHHYECYVSQCVPPWVYPAWASLCFLALFDYFLSHVREVFSYYFFKYFLTSFSSLFSFQDNYNVNVDAFNVVPEVSYAIFIFFLSFFYILFCGSELHHSVLQVIYFFFLSYSAIDSF